MHTISVAAIVSNITVHHIRNKLTVPNSFYWTGLNALSQNGITKKDRLLVLLSRVSTPQLHLTDFYRTLNKHRATTGKSTAETKVMLIHTLTQTQVLSKTTEEADAGREITLTSRNRLPWTLVVTWNFDILNTKIIFLNTIAS
jgi:hypothetical protein